MTKSCLALNDKANSLKYLKHISPVLIKLIKNIHLHLKSRFNKRLQKSLLETNAKKQKEDTNADEDWEKD